MSERGIRGRPRPLSGPAAPPDDCGPVTESGHRSDGVDGTDAHVAWAVREWPDIDPLVEGVVGRISAADRRLHRAAVDTLAELGLSHGEFKVLMRLIGGTRSHGDIARDLVVSTGTMTNRLDKLEAAGLVSRRPDPDDRRGVLVELTASGRNVLDRYISVQAGRERQLLRHLSRSERQALNELLRKLLVSITREADRLSD